MPIVLCFGMYRGGSRYDLYFESFSEGLALPRRGAAAELRCVVQRYAARLEHHVRQDPYNWFNWYDFWNSADAIDAATDAHDGRRGGIEVSGRTA